MYFWRYARDDNLVISSAKKCQHPLRNRPREGGQRVGSPRVRAHQRYGRTLGSTSRALLPPTFAWWHAKVVLIGFLIYLRRADLQVL